MQEDRRKRKKVEKGRKKEGVSHKRKRIKVEKKINKETGELCFIFRVLVVT